MRILVDLQSCQTGSRYRGIGRYSMALLKAMLANPRDHEFVVVLNGALSASIEPIRGELAGLIPQENIRVWQQPRESSPNMDRNAWRRKAAELMRETFIRQWRPDVVHISSVFEGVADEAVVSINRYHHGPPVAVTHYDLIPHFYRDKYLLSEQMRTTFDDRIATLQRADLFLAISAYSAQELSDTLGIDPAATVDMAAGVSSVFRKLEIGRQEKENFLSKFGLTEKFLLYTGGGDVRKNIDNLIRAYARIPETLRAKHCLLLLSKMPPTVEAQLRDLARSLNVERQVRFIDFVSDNDLVRLYNLCGAAVLPSFHEGFGLPLLEAMACGAPAVGANRTSIPEVLGREHAMFDPSDVAAMAEKLCMVLEDKAFADRLRSEGLLQAKKFGWARSAEIALDAIERLHEKSSDVVRLPVQVEMNSKPSIAVVAEQLEDSPGRQGWSRFLNALTRKFDVTVVTRSSFSRYSGVPGTAKRISAKSYKKKAMCFAHRFYRVTPDTTGRWIVDLALEFPGWVSLEDFSVGSLFYSNTCDLSRELYVSHGYRPLLRLAGGASASELIEQFPCNRSLLKSATNVFLATEEEMTRARRMYGDNIGTKLHQFDFSPRNFYPTSTTHSTEAVDFLENLRLGVHSVTTVDLARDLVAIDSMVAPSNEDIKEIAECVIDNVPDHTRVSQLFVDISELAINDARSGIQRVVRAVVLELLSREFPGYRVEPVYRTDDRTGYRYARSYVCRMFDLGGALLEDSPIEPRQGDVFLRLDLVLNGADVELQHLRDQGVKVYEVVYDLLPVKWPEHFIPEMPPVFHSWLDETARYADGVVCISKAVADEFIDWLDGWQLRRSRPLNIGYFHLGSDIEKSVPTHGISNEVESVLSDENTCTFLMVGTIESRKGYQQVLDAFDNLWNAGSTVRLVIVGRQGWLVDELVQRLKGHPENGRFLFWLNDISDEALMKLYGRSDALIMASVAEGFGLPLIEAARHDVSLITRDLPVFREIAGNGAYYFQGETGEALADALTQWMALHERGEAPDAKGVEILNWEQSLDQLLAVILHGNWYREWLPMQRYFVSPARNLMETGIGLIRNHKVHATGQGGLLVASRPFPVEAGQYDVRLKMEIGSSTPDGCVWYEFLSAAEGSVFLRLWPMKNERDVNGAFFGNITLEHAFDDLQFRLWIATGADITFSSMELTPSAKAAHSQKPADDIRRSNAVKN